MKTTNWREMTAEQRGKWLCSHKPSKISRLDILLTLKIIKKDTWISEYVPAIYYYATNKIEIYKGCPLSIYIHEIGHWIINMIFKDGDLGIKIQRLYDIIDYFIMWHTSNYSRLCANEIINKMAVNEF